MSCPITGEPLLNPGQTISHTALQQLRNATNDLAGLMQLLDCRLAGEGTPERAVHVHSIPSSKPPISLGLLDAVDDHRDTIEAWAWNIMQHVNPSYRLPRLHDWHTIEQIYQQHLLSLTTWEYAPNMYDELTDALTRLNHVINPTPQAATPIDPNELTNRYLTTDNCRTALKLHWNIDLPTATIRSWKHRGHITPDAHGRYLLADLLALQQAL